MEKSVLIVEDNQSLQKALSEKLEHEGFKIYVGNNGQEGLISAYEHHPDIILLDFMMPVMNGLEMLAELRKDEWGKDAKVILLTNSNDPESVSTAVLEGVIAYFTKAYARNLFCIMPLDFARGIRLAKFWS